MGKYCHMTSGGSVKLAISLKQKRSVSSSCSIGLVLWHLPMLGATIVWLILRRRKWNVQGRQLAREVIRTDMMLTLWSTHVARSARDLCLLTVVIHATDIIAIPDNLELGRSHVKVARCKS